MLLTKRALIFAIVSYAISFAIGITYSLTTGFDPSQSVGEYPFSFSVAIVVGSAFSSIVATYLYFTHKNPKLKPDVGHGLKFGVTMLVVGVMVDAILFIPFVVSQGKGDLLLSYYGNPYFYIALLGVLVSASGVGWFVDKNK